jgi:hypothetical protein
MSAYFVMTLRVADYKRKLEVSKNRSMLVDGGGGVLYEQDVSDDDEEPVGADQQSDGKDDEP